MVKGFPLSFGCWYRFSDVDWLFILKILLQPCYNISGRNLPRLTTIWRKWWLSGAQCCICLGIIKAALVFGLFQYSAERFSAGMHTGELIEMCTSVSPINVSKFGWLKISYLNVVCFLLGDSPAPEFYMPTFRNTLFHLHRQVGACLHAPTYLWRWKRQSVPKRRHIEFRRQGITQKKAYNIQYTAKVWNQVIYNLKMTYWFVIPVLILLLSLEYRLQLFFFYIKQEAVI